MQKVVCQALHWHKISQAALVTGIHLESRGAVSLSGSKIMLLSSRVGVIMVSLRNRFLETFNDHINLEQSYTKNVP